MPIISIEKFLRGGYVMKKSYLAAAAILGAAVFAGEAHAVKIDLGNGKSFKMGVRGVIYAEIPGKRKNNQKSDITFAHKFARFYAKGKLNKMISFGFQTEFSKFDSKAEIIDSFLNIKFANEFNVIAGSYKVPFERHSGINSGWAVLFPMPFEYGKFKYTGTDSNDYKLSSAFTNPVDKTHKPFRSGSRSAGLTFWGNVAGGLFKYYVGVFDTLGKPAGSSDPKPAYAIRVQFTPTMAGFKPEKGYVLKDTYTGKKNVLTVGLAYVSQGYHSSGNKTQKSYGVDVLWEQNLGGVVPNLSAGYVKHKDWGGKSGKDRTGFIVQGGVMFNVNTILGKPALVAKYTQTKEKNSWKVKNFGVAVNMYLHGPTNRIALGVNNVKVSNAPAKPSDVKDSYTDVKLALFYNF